MPNGISNVFALELFDVLENFFTRGIFKFPNFYDAVVCDKFLFWYYVYSSRPRLIREVAFCISDIAAAFVILLYL